jgi:hypothetical protein
MSLRAFLCPHAVHGPIDENGQALCADCGEMIQYQLTVAVLERAFEEWRPRGRED